MLRVLYIIYSFLIALPLFIVVTAITGVAVPLDSDYIDDDVID